MTETSTTAPKFHTVTFGRSQTVHGAFAVSFCGSEGRRGMIDQGMEIEDMAVSCKRCIKAMNAARERDHAEALTENENRIAAETQATPAYRVFQKAVYAAKSYRGALDLLHVEALAEVGGKMRKADAIQCWLIRHNIFLKDGSEADCERVADLYHAAMAQDLEEAHDSNRGRNALTVIAGQDGNPAPLRLAVLTAALTEAGHVSSLRPYTDALDLLRGLAECDMADENRRRKLSVEV